MLATESISMRKIDRDLKYEGTMINLVVNTYVTPEGQEFKREMTEHRGAAAVLPLLGNDRVVLVEQFRPGANRKLLEIPAGCLEVGEDPRACAARELEEETGYRAGKLDTLFSFFPSPGILDEHMHIFLATDLQETGKLNPDEDEHVNTVVMTFQELRVQLRVGNIKDGKTIAALGYLFTFRPYLGADTPAAAAT